MSERTRPCVSGSRRLSPLLAVGAFVALAMAATSCSSGGSGSRSAGAASSAGALNPNATLLVNTDLAVAGQISFDPTQGVSQVSNMPWQLGIYDSLLHRDAKTGAFTPGLATGATVISPTTVSITLRPGVKFSDGTPFDAAAVKFGLQRNAAAPQHGQLNPVLKQITAVDVTGPLALTVHFSSPVAGVFYDQLNLTSTYIVSPVAAQKPGANLVTSPVGAGPYVLGSYVPDQSITLVKNPGYWDAKDIHLASIKFVNVNPGPQEVNALEGGSVDVETLTSPSEIPVVRGSYNVEEVPGSNDGVSVPMCKSSPPLANTQVRQALNYAVDRNLIVQKVLDGVGEPGWSLWPSGTPYYDSSLVNMYAYDPQKAKQMLAAAGYPNGFSVSMIVQGAGMIDQVFQVLQEEWKAIGVDLTLLPSQNPVVDFYLRHAAPTSLLAQNAGAGTFGILNPFTPGLIGDVCNYNDPTITSLATTVKGMQPTTPQAIALLRQIQKLVYQQALEVFIANTPVVVAYDRSVRNLVVNPYYYGGLPILDYWSGVGIAE